MSLYTREELESAVERARQTHMSMEGVVADAVRWRVLQELLRAPRTVWYRGEAITRYHIEFPARPAVMRLESFIDSVIGGVA